MNLVVVINCLSRSTNSYPPKKMTKGFESHPFYAFRSPSHELESFLY